MISEANSALIRPLWPNCRHPIIPDNFIGTCYAYELAEALDKAREEGRREIIEASKYNRIGAR